MAKYRGSVITKLGIDMQGAVQASDRLVYTHALIGSKDISRFRDLERLRRVPGNEIRGKVLSIENLGDGRSKIRVNFDNRNVRTGFEIRTIGLYARIDRTDTTERVRNIISDWRERWDALTDAEILEALRIELPDIALRPFVFPALYAVTYADVPDFLPPYNGQSSVEFNVDIIVITGGAENVNIAFSRDNFVQKVTTPDLDHPFYARPGETIKIKIRNYVHDHAYIFNCPGGRHEIHGDTITWTTPMSPGSRNLEASVQAMSPGLVVSDPAKFIIGVLDFRNTIDKPEARWPHNGRGISHRSAIFAGDYENNRLFNRHFRSQFAISDDNTFLAEPIVETVRKKRLPISRIFLNEGQNYYWKARYQGHHSLWSDWSDTRVFFIRNILFDITRQPVKTTIDHGQRKAWARFLPMIRNAIIFTTVIGFIVGFPIAITGLIAAIIGAIILAILLLFAGTIGAIVLAITILAAIVIAGIFIVVGLIAAGVLGVAAIIAAVIVGIVLVLILIAAFFVAVVGGGIALVIGGIILAVIVIGIIIAVGLFLLLGGGFLVVMIGIAFVIGAIVVVGGIILAVLAGGALLIGAAIVAVIAVVAVIGFVLAIIAAYTVIRFILVWVIGLVLLTVKIIAIMVGAIVPTLSIPLSLIAIPIQLVVEAGALILTLRFYAITAWIAMIISLIQVAIGGISGLTIVLQLPIDTITLIISVILDLYIILRISLPI